MPEKTITPSEEKKPAVVKSVRDDKPHPTLEMPGPAGHEVRRAEFDRKLKADRVTENTNQTAENNFADNTLNAALVSKDDVRVNRTGLLSPAFQNSQDKGRKR